MTEGDRVTDDLDLGIKGRKLSHRNLDGKKEARKDQVRPHLHLQVLLLLLQVLLLEQGPKGVGGSCILATKFILSALVFHLFYF